MKYPKATLVRFLPERCAILGGCRAFVVRQSRTTGWLTVSLLDSRGAYKKGVLVNVAPYDVRKETPDAQSTERG